MEVTRYLIPAFGGIIISRGWKPHPLLLVGMSSSRQDWLLENGPLASQIYVHDKGHIMDSQRDGFFRI